MFNLNYVMLIYNSKKPELVRKKMVERYYQTGNASQVAREYGTRRQTVSLWVERFEKEGESGLKDRSKVPKSIPHKTPDWLEERIIKMAIDKKKRIGQDRIALNLETEGINISSSTVNRIMHENDLIKKRTRKYKKKKQIQEYKKKLDALRDWQVDVKDLIDIPNIYALVKEKIILRYQYSARDVITGTSFVCYNDSDNLNASISFVWSLLEHLRKFNIHSSEVTIQTDNGSEFIGSIRQKEPSGFEKLIEQTYNAKHQTIPVGKKEWQGAVESFHNRIEDEFYDVEKFSGLEDFLAKAHSYILYYNLKRKRLEDKKSPFHLIKEKCHIFDTQIANFKPYILDEVNAWSYHYKQKSVRYVADEVKLGLTFKLKLVIIQIIK
jgi:transposase